MDESEARYRALAAASADVIYRMSPDWSEMRELDGRGFLADTAEPSSAWLEHYIHPDDRPRVTAAVQAAVREKRVFELEHRVLRADGETGWTFSRAVPVLDEQGAIVEWIGTATDITAHRQALEALDAAKTYAESIVETLHEPLLVLTPDLRVRSANQAFYADFKVRPEETEGQRIYELGNGQWDIPELRRLLEDVLPDSRVFNDYEVSHEFEDIGRRVMLLNARRLDHVQLILLGIRDITDRSAARERQASLLSRSEASEARYRTLFDSIDEGFCVIEVLFDTDGRPHDYRILEANPAFVRQTGLVDAIGRSVREMVPGHEAHWYETYGRIARTGRPERFEAPSAALGRFYDVYAFRIGNPDANRLALLFTDISERKRAEALMRETEERQSFLIGLSDALRPLADPDEITATAARRLARRFQADRAYCVEWPPGEDYAEVARDYAAPGLPSLAGRYPADVFSGAYRRISTGDSWVVEDAAAAGELDAEERDRYLASGVAAWVDVPLIKDGQIRAALCLVHAAPRSWTSLEISLAEETAERCWAAIERGRAEVALRESEERYRRLSEQERVAREEAERALRVRDEFLAIVSHELRTPLAAMLLWARLLSLGRVPGREREAADTIERNAEAQRVLIEDLLDASRFMAGKVELELHPMQLSPLVAEVADAMRPVAIEHDVSLQVGDDEPVAAAVDPQRFAQALRALIDNAIRYSNPGGTVTLSVHADGGAAVVAIHDTGRGIDPDMLPYVFDRFRRGGDSSGGLGLGLSIAHDIVELHGGTLTAESPGRGMGSTFKIRLPMAEPPRRTTRRGTGGVRTARAPRRLAGRRVLVVDDDADTLVALQLALEVEGASVVTADNGRGAIQLLASDSAVDAIVSDLAMADGDGFEVIRAVRDGEAGGRRRAIALTARVVDEQRSRALEAGFDVYLAKPVTEAELVRALASGRRRRNG